MSQQKVTADIQHVDHADAEKGSSTHHDGGGILTFDLSKENTAELDIAVEALKGQSLEFTEAEEKAVLRKIDWRLIPMCAWACGLQFVDKSGLGSAAVYGMRADLHLVGQQYSWCVAAFYFGYLFSAPIAGRVLQRFHAGKVVGGAMILWSITLLGMLGVKNFAATLVLRILLGVFESSLVPGLTLITTMWYTHKEQPWRFGVFTCLNGGLPIPFIVIYYALGHITNGALAPWRYIFLLIGLISLVTGVILFLCLPDSPMSVGWLNERERAIAVERVAQSQTGVKNTHFKWAQAKEALTDVHVWLLTLEMFTSQAIGNVTTNFLGIVISGFGYTALKAQLYTAPNSAVQFVIQLLITFLPSYILLFRNHKQNIMTFVTAFSLTGACLLYTITPAADNQKERLFACILLSFNNGNYSQVLATMGTNIGGFTKKQVATSMLFVAYCAINIITPQTFLAKESPRYHTGLGFVMGMTATFIVICWLNTFIMNRENRRRDKLAETDPAYATGINNTDLLSGLRDQTDRENKHHRYSA